MKKNKPIILLMLALCSFATLKAATRTWTGGTSSSWSTSSNWQGGNVPSSSDDVIINSGASNYPTLGANTTVRSLTLNAGSFSMSIRTFRATAFITINGGTFNAGSNTLTADNNVTIDGGTFSASSGAINIGNALSLISGTYTASSGTLTTDFLDIEGGTFTAAGGNITVNNDFTITDGSFTGSSGTISGDNFDLNGGTFTFRGNTITLGNNFTIDGASVVITSSDFEVDDDLFLVSGSLDMNNFDIVVSDETTIEGAMTVLDKAMISTADLILDFSGSINLNYHIYVRTSATYSLGVLVTSSSNTLTFAPGAGSGTTSASSHINGPVRKEITSSGPSMSPFTFPTGNGTVVAPLRIDNYNNRRNGDFFTAQYFNLRNPNAGGTRASGIDHVSQAEYWDLTRGTASGTATTQVRVNLSFNETNRSGLVDNRTQLVIAHWTGTQWENLGNSATSGNNIAGDVTANTRSTTYSPFTLASTNSLNPLPIQLLNFTAYRAEAQVSVKWATTSEINNNFFTVLKSLDGINWIEIGTVKAVGNSNVIQQYGFADLRPVKGIQYYRLKQTDNNGDYTLSAIVPVNFGAANTQVQLYPVPANQTLNVNVENPENSQVTLKITNVMGVVVKEVQFSSDNTQINMSELANGVYMVHVSLDGNLVSVNKVLKN